MSKSKKGTKFWRFFKKYILVFVIFFGISLLLHLWANDFDFTEIINGGDTDYPINAALELEGSLNTWKDESLGVSEYFPISRIFLSLPIFVLNLIFTSSVANILFFSLIWSLSGFTMYLFLTTFSKRRGLNFFIGLFYMSNIFAYMRYHTPMIHIQYLYFSTPLLMFIFTKVVTKKWNINLGSILFALVMISISRTINMWAILWVFVPLIVFVFSKVGLFDWKLKFKEIVRFFLQSILINAVVIVTLFASALNYLSDAQSNLLMEYYRNTQQQITTKYNLFESMAGLGSYSWVNYLSDELPGWQAYSIFRDLPKTFWLAISVFPIIFALISGFKKKRFWIIPLLLIVLLLMNGSGMPLGELYNRTLGSLPVYRDFFRDPWGYWGIIYFFLISVLILLGLSDLIKLKSDKKGFKWISMIPIFVLVGVFLTQFFLMYISPGKIVSEAWWVNIPEDYKQISDFLNDEEGSKVLPLPITSQAFGYTETDWGYKGPDILNRMSDVNILDTHLSFLTSESYSDLISVLEFPSEEALTDVLDRTSTNYVLLRNDFKDDENESSLVMYSDIVNSSDCFKSVVSTSKLELFEYTCFDEQVSEWSYSHNYYFGDWACGNGLGIEDDSASYICKSLQWPKEGIEIVYNVLQYEFEGISGVVSSQGAESDSVMINDTFLTDDIVLKENNVVSIDLSDGKYDLIDNWDFSQGNWNNDIYTCVDGYTSEDIVVNSDDGLGVESFYKPYCLYTNIQQEGINNDEVKGLLNIKYKDVEGNQVPTVNIYSEEKQQLLYSIDLIEDVLDPSLGITLELKESNDGFRDYYIYFEDLSFLDRGTYLYLLFNQGVEYMNVHIDSVRFIYLDSDIDGVNLVSKNVDREIFDVNELSVKEFWSGLFNVVDVSSIEGSVLISNTRNFNSNWLVLGIDSDHVLVNGFANGWLIDGVGSYDSLFIIYFPQVLYIIGFLISFIGLLIVVI